MAAFSRLVTALGSRRSTTSGWTAFAVVALALAASYGISYLLGGAGAAAPHWFYVPIILAGAWSGPVAALAAAAAATVLAGPLLPLDVSEGIPQPGSHWVSEGALFFVIGAMIAMVLSARGDAERALRRAELRYRSLVENIPAAVYVEQPDEVATALYMSPHYEQIMGFTAEERLANPTMWVERLHEEDRERVLAEGRRANETGEPYRTEYRLRTRDGGTVWVRDEAYLVKDGPEGQRYWQGFIFDITARRASEDALRKTAEELRRTEAQRQQLLRRLVHAQEEERASIAGELHDDPIQRITAAAMRLFVLRQAETDPRRASAIEDVERSMLGTVDRLRTLMFELRPQALNEPGGLPSLLKERLDDLAAETGVAVRFHDDVHTEPSPEVRAICYRIAAEALVNVRKHSCATMVDVAVVSTQDGGVLVRITDDGMGFDPETLERRARHLGLFSMRERAELAGGRWTIRSTPNCGTAIEFWIPEQEALARRAS